MECIRILIADDHAVFRDGLRGLLASLPDTEVVGEAASGDDSVAQAAAVPMAAESPVNRSSKRSLRLRTRPSAQLTGKSPCCSLLR